MVWKESMVPHSCNGDGPFDKYLISTCAYIRCYWTLFIHVDFINNITSKHYTVPACNR